LIFFRRAIACGGEPIDYHFRPSSYKMMMFSLLLLCSWWSKPVQTACFERRDKNKKLLAWFRVAFDCRSFYFLYYSKIL
jgi:hypothetical protein